MTWELRKFSDNQFLVNNFSGKIVIALNEAIEKRGHATLAVSGGSTPTKLFEKLSSATLDWSKVIVTLVDERWVPADHPDSNARLVKMSLLKDQAASATFFALTNSAETPFAGEDMLEKQLSELSWPLDVSILGMGNDGHTASFFPGAETLSAALDLESSKHCCAISPPAAPHARMTLTLSSLLDSRHLFLHIVGKEKWQVLHSAIQPGSNDQLPVRAVLHQTRKLVDIFYAPY